MKSGTWPIVEVTALLLALTLPAASIAQDGETNKPKHHHYKLIDLGTLGGSNSYLNPGSGQLIGQYARVLNEHGAVVGLANTSSPDPFPNFCFDPEGDCFLTHAFRTSREGTLIDLRDLRDGGGSAATWIADNGLIAGVSRNGEIDPLFSTPEFPAIPEIQAVVWKNGEITDLGTLPKGGYESYGAAVNSAGQVVGAATNTVPDANSMTSGTFWLGNIPYPFQTRAFIWQRGKGMVDLGTLPGGSDAQAILINEAGQVIGYSYTGSEPSSLCPFPLATGSFIWEQGTGMKDLGNLGGTCTLANDINQRGEVVGGSLLPGDQAEHAFLWEQGSMHDLGGSLGGNSTGAFAINEEANVVGFATLPYTTLSDATFHAVLWRKIGQMTDLGVLGADQCSYAASINAKMQAVGSSLSTCNADTGPVTAFLWEDGSIFDLNSLVASDSALYLVFTQTINDRGEIAGTGIDTSDNNNEHAFLLIPCDENHPNIDGCDYSLVEARADATTTDSTRIAPRLATPDSAPAAPPWTHLPRNRWVPRLRWATPQAKALGSTATTAGLTITSGTPPNGTVGVSYGPSTTEYFKCVYNPVLGWHWACFLCNPSIAGSCPTAPCTHPVFFPNSCLQTRQVFGGFTLKAAGGVPPYSWSAAGIPPGLTLNSQTGTISGTPTAAGTYDIAVTVHDSASPPASAGARYIIVINP